MSDLLKKMRRARESNVDAGGYTFTIRRPTDLEIAEMSGRATLQIDLVRDFVVGWKGVKEIDLVPGGTGVEVEFDLSVYREWIVDRPELWADISTAVMQAYQSYRETRGEAAKN